jgi:hypothetical protein
MPGGNNLNSVLFAAVIPSEAGGEGESFDVRVKPEIRRLGSMTNCEIG